MGSAAPPSDLARTAGRGVLFIAIAKMYFMVAGYAIYFGLPRLLKTQVDWGNYLLVIGLASVINNVMVTVTIQAVSRFTAQSDAVADAVKRTALRVQLLLGGATAILFFLAAPLIAGFEKDPSLAPFYRIASGIVLCYALYAVFVGSVNGQRRFGQQASLDMSYATLKCIFILGFASLGWGVAGGVGGFVTAAAVILLIAAVWVGLPKGTETFGAAPFLRFIGQLFLYTLFLNLIMKVDLFLLKRYAGELATAGADPATVASEAAALYGTAQTLAFIPYQAILAVAFVVFPLVSRAIFEGDIEATRSYIRQTLRFSLIFVAGVSVVFIANPDAVINVPYPALYRQGGVALRVLAAGMVCLSMFTIVNTILNGAGRTRQTIVAGAITLAMAIAANAIFVPRAKTLAGALQTAAGSTAVAMALGVVISTVLLHREFKAGFAPATVVRALVGMAVAAAVGIAIPEVSRLVTIVECAVVGLTYLATLTFLGEFTREDLARIKRIIRR